MTDILAQEIREAHGKIVIKAGSVSMCANRDEEWVVYLETSPPKLLYRGIDTSKAMWCLVRGRELPDDTRTIEQKAAAIAADIFPEIRPVATGSKPEQTAD